jgi:peroxiredoxin
MHAYRDQYAQVFNGGQDVVLIAISSDPVEAQASWMKDDQFQFVMASDANGEASRAYGSFNVERESVGGRNLFVIGPDGRIAHRALPFREVDAQAYEDLGAAIRRLIPPPDPGN